MVSLFGLGFVLGMKHAIEADHAAAVASLALHSRSLSHTLRQGLAWGIGHTFTLLVFSSIVLLLGLAIPDRFAQGLEFFVGLMLLALGFDVLRKMWTSGLHLHIHEHPDQGPHVHFHAHPEPERQTPAQPHNHSHLQSFPYRALLVGLMHGMAGSAALILLTLQTVISPSEAMIYILLFGLGSTLGMGVFSLVMAIPFWYSTRSFTHWHHGIQVGVGMFTIFLGISVLFRHAGWLFG